MRPRAVAFRAAAASFTANTTGTRARIRLGGTPTPFLPRTQRSTSTGCGPCLVSPPSASRPTPPLAATSLRVRPVLGTPAALLDCYSSRPPPVASSHHQLLKFQVRSLASTSAAEAFLSSAVGRLAVVNAMSSSHRSRRDGLAADIEDLHSRAVLAQQETYIDPRSGLTVFTELAHRRRGRCCGSRCRHCPYTDWSGGVAVEVEVDEGTSAASILREEEETPSTSAGGSANQTKKKNVPYTRTGDQGTAQLLTGERRSKADDSFEALGTVDELCATVGVAHAMILERGLRGGAPNGSIASADNDADASASAPTNSVAVSTLEDWLLQVMSRLFDVGSHLAKPKRVRHHRDEKGGKDDEEEDDASSSSSSSSEEGFAADGVGGGLDAQHVNDLEAWIDALTADLPELRSFVLPSGTVASAQLHVARCVCRRAERGVVNLVQSGSCDPTVLRYLNRLSDFLFVASRWVNQFEGGHEFRYQRPAPGATQRVVMAPNKS